MTASLVTIGNEQLSAAVSPLGAELQYLRTASGHDLLWHGDDAFWSGRAPVLFPVVGRAPHDRISVGDFSADMKQHGFARRSEFALEAHTSDMCRFVLTDNEATRAQYPFAFRLAVTHHIVGATLQTSVEVLNQSDTPMPFGFGFHPAFVWPLPDAQNQQHSITLANQAEPKLARLKDGLLPPERHESPFKKGQLRLAYSQFDQDAMIFPEGAGSALSYAAQNGAQLSFTFENLPNLALWTKPNAPFICVEPWHGMAAHTTGSDQIADRPNTTILEPLASTSFKMTVTVAL